MADGPSLQGKIAPASCVGFANCSATPLPRRACRAILRNGKNRCDSRREGASMGKFVISPHFRLHEWIAEEKGYFKAVGL
ncbi:MAG: hypothetical protein ACJ79W_26800, partial [Myxococcales bacterium]